MWKKFCQKTTFSVFFFFFLAVESDHLRFSLSLVTLCLKVVIVLLGKMLVKQFCCYQKNTDTNNEHYYIWIKCEFQCFSLMDFVLWKYHFKSLSDIHMKWSRTLPSFTKFLRSSCRITSRLHVSMRLFTTFAAFVPGEKKILAEIIDMIVRQLYQLMIYITCAPPLLSLHQFVSPSNVSKKSVTSKTHLKSIER